MILLFKVPMAAKQNDVCLQKTSKSHSYHLNPLPDNKILDRSKLKQSTDDNSKFDENSRKFSKLVENTVGKGEIVRYKQFLLSLSVFKRLVSQGRQKVPLCGDGFKYGDYYDFMDR